MFPPPLSALFETINSCSSAKDLAKQFDSLKAHAQEYADQIETRLPIIPMEVEICLSSLIVLNFVELIDEIVKKEIEKFIEDSLDYEYLYNETMVYLDCAIIQLDCPREKLIIESECIKPFKDLLLENFDVQVKSVVFA